MNTLQHIAAGSAAIPSDVAKALATVLAKVAPLSKEVSDELEKVQPIMNEIVAALEVPLPEITNGEILQAVGEEALNIRRMWDKAEDARKILVRPINETKDTIQEFFRPFMDGLWRREGECDKLVLDFKKAAEAARRQEEERLRKLAEAEQRRLAAEAEKKAKKVEGDDPSLAEQIRESVPTVPVPIVARQDVKLPGIGFKRTWKARIVEPALVPREWCLPDQKALDKLAASNGPKQEGVEHPLQGKVAGVQFYPVDGTIKKTGE